MSAEPVPTESILFNGGHLTNIKAVFESVAGTELIATSAASESGNEQDALISNSVILEAIRSTTFTDKQKAEILSNLNQQFITPYATVDSALTTINDPKYPENMKDRSRGRLKTAEKFIAYNSVGYAELLNLLPDNLGPEATKRATDLRRLITSMSQKRD